MDGERYGWGEVRSKIYHRLRQSRSVSQKGKWVDCNSWERKPHAERPAHLMPCKKCLYAEWYFAINKIRV